MKYEAHQRIAELRAEQGLTVLDFCQKTVLSTATYVNIQNGEPISDRSIKRISDGLNVNKEWLLTGKGEKFSSAPIESEKNTANPYKDALVIELKSQVDYLRNMLQLALSGKSQANFNEDLIDSGQLFESGLLSPAA